MRQDLINLLKKEYPTAREGFIEILIQALEMHSKKNNDYNGTAILLPANITSLYYDIRRKFSRLHNIIASESETMVDEKLEDTAIDLGNYAFLLAEVIKKELK